MLPLHALLLLPPWLSSLPPTTGVAAAPRDNTMLSMAASSSSRPKECSGSAGQGERAWHPTIWDLARQPALRRYCDLLGRAQARLTQSPASAREAATVADQILPGHAAPWVVRARANAALHNYNDALKDFEHARSVDPRSVEEPLALHDLADSQRRAGKTAEAMNTYRALVPRLALLPGVIDKVSVLLEASSLAMTMGDDGVHEAIALLTEARNQPASRLDPDLLALLALVLDRSGATEQSAAVLESSQRRGLQLPARGADAFAYLADPSDSLAMSAIALEPTDPKRAAELWEAYLSEAHNSRCADHAKRRLEACRAAASKVRARPAAPPAPTAPTPKPAPIR